MPTQIFDDGSILTTDGAGNVVEVRDASGALVPATHVLDRFADVLIYGVRAFFDSRFPRPSVQTAPPPSSGIEAQLAGLMPLLLLGGIAYLVFRALK